MMKEVKCNKDHKCLVCGKTIKKGDIAIYCEGREPMYAIEDGKATEYQEGIKYLKWWEHVDECIS